MNSHVIRNYWGLPMLLGVILILSGCLPGWNTADSATVASNRSLPSNSLLNPPAWIQGTWSIGGSYTFEFEFTQSTVISRSSGVTVDYEQIYTRASVEIHEEISNSYYSFFVKNDFGNVDQEIKFEKLGNFGINYILTDNGLGVTIGPTTLYRVN